MSIELPPVDFYEKLAVEARLKRMERENQIRTAMGRTTEPGSASAMPEIALDLKLGEQLPE